jgi:small conductance mechanosensitive channel
MPNLSQIPGKVIHKLTTWPERSDQLSYLRALSEAMIAIKRAKLTIPFPIRTLDFGADVVGGVRVDATQLSPAAAPAREAPAPS